MLQENLTWPSEPIFRDNGNHFDHPHSGIFGPYADRIMVGANPHASVVACNPRFAGLEFGVFRIPTMNELRMQDQSALAEVKVTWSLWKNHAGHGTSAFIPPETGRALLLHCVSNPIWPDILIKGVGLIKRFTVNNKLRFAARGFNGCLELSEAERDLVNSEILHHAGVLVAAPLGIVDHHHVHDHGDFTAWTANYVRGFRCQTRVSNLFDLDPTTRKAAIDDAITRLTVAYKKTQKLSYAEYFQFILEVSARNVAIMQAVGFTQEGLHYGQITLCGEIVDFGIGNFRRPERYGEMNSMYPWFRFERQPVLMQNILFKTHAVKAEPSPIRLDRNCRAILEQETLFGAIRSFSAEAAEEIEKSNPEKIFWQIYESTYRRFNFRQFKENILDKIDTYFNWEPLNALKYIPNEIQQTVFQNYLESLNQLNQHFENQVETWDRRGPLSMHKQILFISAVRSLIPGFKLDLSAEPIGIWENYENYLCENQKDGSCPKDISWKPTFDHC